MAVASNTAKERGAFLKPGTFLHTSRKKRQGGRWSLLDMAICILETIIYPLLTYRQPHPLEEGAQQVALAAGSQQETCSAGGQQEEDGFGGGVFSTGCLGRTSSFTWDVLPSLISDSFMLWFLSLGEIARVRLTRKDEVKRKRTHRARQSRSHSHMVISEEGSSSWFGIIIPPPALLGYLCLRFHSSESQQGIQREALSLRF